MEKEARQFFADKCVESAMKEQDNGESLRYAITGAGLYYIESNDNGVHNYVEVIDAIYRFYSLNPDIDVPNEMKNAFEQMVAFPGSLPRFYVILGAIKYENRNEVEGISPFTLDIDHYMAVLLESVKKSNKLKDNPQAYELFNEFLQLIKADREKFKS